MRSPPRGAIVLAAALVALLVFVLTLRPHEAARGNRLVVINAGSTSVDSILVEPEPPGANLLSARSGYLAVQDSVWLVLPAATGDADVRVFRGENTVAHQAAYFGGNSVFELRVGDRDQLGRYRRTN